MPEAEEKKLEPMVDIDTSGPEVEVNVEENKKEEPKVEEPKEEIKVEEVKEEPKAEEPEVDLSKKENSKLPEPTGWRVLVLPFKMKDKTKGGLYLGQETLERQQVASQCGLVLKMGSQCYDKERYPEGPQCKKGDWVIYARYAGSTMRS